MPDEPNPTTPAADPTANTEPEPTGVQTVEPGEQVVPGEKFDELPEWARKALTKANNEAAGYRTRLRDTEAKFADAKTPAEVETVLSELRTTNAELQRRLLVADVARKAALPDDLADLLKGSNREELEAHAKKLQKYAVSPETPGELSGGLDPHGDDDAFDPVKTARAAKLSRY